jgi:ubiquinone/menaquinone biosynthesis C-methylase UbiE
MDAQTEVRNGNGTKSGPPPSGRDFAAWNESMVERYDIEEYYAHAHPIVRWIERHRLRALLELAAPRAGEALLEVGCGAGHVLQRFGGTRRTGVDLSPNMLGRARQRLKDEAKLMRASADRLPFGDGSYDIVLCTEVLEHTPDPAAVIAELMRVAGAHGRVVVSVPNEVNIDRAKRMIRRVPGLRTLMRTLSDEGNEWHLHHFDLAFLKQIVAGQAVIRQLRSIPGPVLPIRYVALLAATESPGRSA